MRCCRLGKAAKGRVSGSFRHDPARFFLMGGSTIRRFFSKLWKDDCGALIATEWVLVATILVIGIITGLVAVRQAAIVELRGCEKMGTGSGRPAQNPDNIDCQPVPVPVFSQTLSQSAAKLSAVWRSRTARAPVMVLTQARSYRLALT